MIECKSDTQFLIIGINNMRMKVTNLSVGKFANIPNPDKNVLKQVLRAAVNNHQFEHSSLQAENTVDLFCTDMMKKEISISTINRTKAIYNEMEAKILNTLI